MITKMLRVAGKRIGLVLIAIGLFLIGLALMDWFWPAWQDGDFGEAIRHESAPVVVTLGTLIAAIGAGIIYRKSSIDR